MLAGSFLLGSAQILYAIDLNRFETVNRPRSGRNAPGTVDMQARPALPSRNALFQPASISLLAQERRNIQTIHAVLFKC